jgi:hypothetical protein
MAKADCVLSTPPTNTPINTTRRRFLSQTAGVAASGAVLALATIPPAPAIAAPASPLDPANASPVGADPIFAVIEGHKAARAIVYSAIDAVQARGEHLAGEGKRGRDREGDTQLEECEAALSRAFECETEAACSLVSERPTTMGTHETSNQEQWARGGTKDLEDEHDGAEPDDNEGGDGAKEDDEPSLGWTLDGQGGATSPEGDECEIGGSVGAEDQTNWIGSGGHDTGTAPAAMKAIRDRFDPFDRHVTNADGKHIDTEGGYGGFKRLRNLSERQKKIVKPRLDNDAVHLT